jgi:protease-4
VRALATGLPFTGTQAISNGLADEVGTREDAIAYAAMLAGIQDDSYSTKNLQISQDSLSGLLDLLSSSSSNTSITAADLAAALKELNDNDGIAQ